MSLRDQANDSLKRQGKCNKKHTLLMLNIIKNINLVLYKIYHSKQCNLDPASY